MKPVMPDFCCTFVGNYTGGYGDSKIRVSDMLEGSMLTTLEGHTAAVYSVAWNRPLGTQLAPHTLDNVMRIWSLW
jgi:WD40 repeat protein